MKFFILLSIVPCIWAFTNDSLRIECPDESYCPVGKTCCAESDQYNCCEIADNEKGNKKLITAFPSHFNKNDTRDVVEEDGSCPNGTKCTEEWCCKHDAAECCSNSTSCCPEDHHCCGTDTTPPRVWCCKTKQRCAQTYFYCIAGASSISSTFMSLIMMIVIAESLKHF